MTTSLVVAHEINSLWLSCIDHQFKTDLASCPSDETVAAIIDRHIPQPETEK